MEAIFPIEVGIPSVRYQWLNKETNWHQLIHSLDTIKELRDRFHLYTTVYQQKVARHYNKNIRVRTFKQGDWVLSQVFQNTKDVGSGKLDPIWEGPYKIIKVVG